MSSAIVSSTCAKGRVRFYCKACQRSLESEITRQQHINGKRHLANMATFNLEENAASADDAKNKGGCKNKAKTILSLEERLKQPLKQPVLGTEHVLECWSAFKAHPVYECRLCECALEYSKILAHLNGVHHLRRCIARDGSNQNALTTSQVYLEARRLEESDLTRSIEVKRDEVLYRSIMRRTRDVKQEKDGEVLKRGRETSTKEEKGDAFAVKKTKVDEDPNNKYEDTEYYEQNGLRKVYPYYYAFTTHSKGRWVGTRLSDVFAEEFSAHTKEHFDQCIKAGRLTVNGAAVSAEYVLRHNDLVANVVHRHELPVVSKPITLLHVDEDLVVVNKPPSIPVHPCGRYRYNSMLFILAKDHSLKDLCTIHRLDRLTSGVLMLARNRAKAREMEQLIRNRLVAKQYLCRVNGVFPEEKLVCREPIKVLSHRVGVCQTAADGKPSITHFERLLTDGKQSVVLCKPETGRMHQIRVHLQYLGFPILNDPLYDSAVFGTERGKGGLTGKSEEQLRQDLINTHADGHVTKTDHVTKNEKRIENDAFQAKKSRLAPFDKAKMTYDETCDECQMETRDPAPNELFMCLHAWKYQGSDWCFETQMPDWARLDWKPQSEASSVLTTNS